MRSRRLEVVGARKNGCARGRHARPFFLAPATQVRVILVEGRVIGTPLTTLSAGREQYYT